VNGKIIDGGVTMTKCSTDGCTSDDSNPRIEMLPIGTDAGESSICSRCVGEVIRALKADLQNADSNFNGVDVIQYLQSAESLNFRKNVRGVPEPLRWFGQRGH